MDISRAEDDAGRFLRRTERLARRMLTVRFRGAQDFWEWEHALLALQQDVQEAISAAKGKPRTSRSRPGVEALQWAFWMSRHLGDAFAWLALGLNDRYIVPLGENTRVSVPPRDSVGIRGVIAIAGVLANQGAGFPVLHDITDCLRIGDITMVNAKEGRKKELFTIEVKTRQVAEKVSADGSAVTEYSIVVHGVFEDPGENPLQAAYEQMRDAGTHDPPVKDAPAEPEMPKRLDRRLERQQARMSRALARQRAGGNEVIKLADDPMIHFTFEPRAVDHTTAVQRVLRRARRTGLASARVDEAFVYAAAYDASSDARRAFDRGNTDALVREVSALIRPESERDGRDAISVNVVLPPNPPTKRASSTLPFFLMQLPRTTIFDIMHRRMTLLGIVNLGVIARRLETEGFAVQLKPRGRFQPELVISFEMTATTGERFKVEGHHFDYNLLESLGRFGGLETLVERIIEQRDATRSMADDITANLRQRRRQRVGG